MHSKSGNIEFMAYDNGNDIVDKLFESLFMIYQIGLETPMRGSNYIFDSVQLLYYKCQNINFKRGVKDDKCFQYAATVALNYGKIESHPESLKYYNWDGIK